MCADSPPLVSLSDRDQSLLPRSGSTFTPSIYVLFRLGHFPLVRVTSPLEQAMFVPKKEPSVISAQFVQAPGL